MLINGMSLAEWSKKSNAEFDAKVKNGEISLPKEFYEGAITEEDDIAWKKHISKGQPKVVKILNKK